MDAPHYKAMWNALTLKRTSGRLGPRADTAADAALSKVKPGLIYCYVFTFTAGEVNVQKVFLVADYSRKMVQIFLFIVVY